MPPSAPAPPTTLEEALRRLPAKKFLTTLEIQHATGVHPVTVYRWVQQKRLKRHRVQSTRGRKSLYLRAEVVRLVRQRFDPTIEPGDNSNDSDRDSAAREAAGRKRRRQ